MCSGNACYPHKHASTDCERAVSMHSRSPSSCAYLFSSQARQVALFRPTLSEADEIRVKYGKAQLPAGQYCPFFVPTTNFPVLEIRPNPRAPHPISIRVRTDTREQHRLVRPASHPQLILDYHQKISFEFISDGMLYYTMQNKKYEHNS